MQTNHISAQDARTARTMLKAVLQTLSLEVRRAVDASGKDGVAPVAHAFFAVEFVGQPQTLESLTPVHICSGGWFWKCSRRACP